MLESSRPFWRLLRGLLKDARFGRILKFDEAILVIHRISDRQVRSMISEYIELTSITDLLVINDIGVVSSHECADVRTGVKEGQYVLPLAEVRFVRVV